MNQPWHRDFPSPPETYEGRRLTSLAFNLTAIDTAAEMGAMEIALGTQWEPGTDFEGGMFPPPTCHEHYASRAVPKLPQAGDISVRSALTVHRGTANRSHEARPVLVLGVDAPGAGHAAMHDLAVTAEYHRRLPDVVRDHLAGPVVDTLPRIAQKHTIDGLLRGVR
jgi:ectoine hydroxylase-related dioxygenase (phytanoyl-CoA dioxygenase family)